jgi:predicted RND superfamily exporter protein
MGVARVQAFANFIVKRRVFVVLAALFVTAFFGLKLLNLKVIVDADELLPRDHPFVSVTERVQAVFGNRYTVVIGVTPRSGSVYTPTVLGKVLAITDRLAQTPGVTRGNLQSLAAPRDKDIAGNAGGLTVSRLLDHVPANAAEALHVRDRLAQNPAYGGVLVSRDERTAAIYVEFKKDPEGFGHVMSEVEAAVAPARSPDVSIAVAGQPVFLSALEIFSKRMAWLLPIAILLIGLIHLEAFRTVQGLLLPLVTAILALVWSLGIMTLAGVHLDPFNNVTPILILAVAAGHAVQMLKRYYEEFDRLCADPSLTPREASRQAVVASMIKVGPVMIAACLIAALSFMSLIVFDIHAIRTFGVFCGLGILSIVGVELTFTPALRAMLPPPAKNEAMAEKAINAWDRVAGWLAQRVITPAARKQVFVLAAVFVVVMAAGASRIVIDNSLRSFFAADTPARIDDAALNQRLAGTNTFYVLVEGKSDDALKDPAVLRAMETTQAWLNRQPGVGHTLSMVDLLKQINRGLNGGAPSAATLPADPALISQYLLLYSLSGEPGDFDGLVDYPYRNGIIQAFVKTDSSAFVADLNTRIAPVIKANFPASVTVRLGGSITTPTAMNEVMVAGKAKNIVQIFAMVFVISALLFRSISLGALILAPLVMTTFAVFGVMGLIGIPLQIATATVSALAIGIGADYAIYLTWRLREELRHGAGEGAAIRATFASAGKAVMFVATAVAGGYAVLMASIGFNVHIWLGFLTCVSMAVAAGSTLTLFAAALLTVRPAVIFGGQRAPHDLGRAVTASLIGLGLIAGLGLGLARPARAADADAARLMAESLKVTNALRSNAIGRFVLTNPGGQTRVRQTLSISELKPDGVHNKRVVRFNAPADIAGTSVLTIENGGSDDDIWVYLPALKKVRRLPSSSRKDAFVGTDFSYGDVLGHPVDEWLHRRLRTETLAGVPTVVIESVARDAGVIASTGYTRRISWLRQSDAVLMQAQYFDAGGTLAKLYTASNIQLVDAANHRFQPMRQVMRNMITGHSTAIEYSSFRTDQPVRSDQFEARALERPF